VAGRPGGCGGAAFNDGEWIVADDDGVVAIAAGELPAVADRTRTRATTEARLLERIVEGAKSIDLFGLSAVLSHYGSAKGDR
jgi:regulator of RNase E activity RraA